MTTEMNQLIISVNELKRDIADIKTAITSLTTSVKHLCSSNEKIESEITKINHRLSHVDNELNTFDKKSNELQEKFDALHERVVAMESYSRRDNLLFEGIPESAIDVRETSQDCIKKIQDVLMNKMKIKDAQDIRVIRCHRLGKPPTPNAGSGAPGRPRTIICRFQFTEDRQRIWRHKENLKGSGTWLQEDFPKEINDRRKRLLPIMFAARTQGHRANLLVDKLHITFKSGESQTYDVSNLHSLPDELDPKLVGTVTKNNFLAFFGQNCPLSNFYEAPFYADGFKYRHVEQFLFCKKAEFARDDASKQKILTANTPAECKKIGKHIKVVQKDWYPEEILVMKKGLREKFMQNAALKEFLIATGEKTLLEASPKDKFWGIGMGLKGVATSDRVVWSGKNRLGEMLMDLRNQLQ